MATNFAKLNLCYGIPLAPLLTATLEKGKEWIDLLNLSGFVLDADSGWIPQIAPLKQGGLYADSPIADGATLIAGQVDNVEETITLISSGATLSTRTALMSQLHNYARLAREYWTLFSQIDPIYLEWEALGAPGAQYALIYSIDIAEQDDPFSNTSASLASRIVLTIKREPYWRGIPPGSNPLVWTFYTRGEEPVTDYTFNNMSLAAAATTHLVKDTAVDNAVRYTGTVTAFTRKNWIDIPANFIPGDAPALVCLTVDDLGGNVTADSVWLGVSVGEITGEGTLSERKRFASVTVQDSDPETDAVITVDTGAASGNRIDTSFATTITMVTRARWLGGGSSGATNIPLNLNAGIYAIFARTRQTGGAVNTITFRVRISQDTNGRPSLTSVISNTATAEILGTTGASAAWNIDYLGTVQIPLDRNAAVDVNGRGINSNGEWQVEFQAARSSGAGVLYFSDLIFIPFDRAMCQYLAGGVTGNALFIDNTGYFGHGRNDVAYCGDGANPRELRGSNGLVLWPKQDNRIYAIATNATAGQSDAVATGGTIALNIVPRWSGVRDV